MNFLKSGTGIALTIAALVLVLGTVLFFTSPASAPSKVVPMGTEYPILAPNHIKVGESHEPYSSNPPTSGPHYGTPANIGFYTDELADEQVVHNLEHGQIWVSYKDVDAATLKELQAYQNRHRLSVIVTRRPANEKSIALASWGRLLYMDAWDVQTAENFVKANINKSPEPLAR